MKAQSLEQLKMLYIGAVAALCRVFNRLDQDGRRLFEEDGQPMERLAADFNSQEYGLEMLRSGTGWALFARAEQS